MSKYGNYDYVQADIDLYNIPEKYHAMMRNIFSKNEAATFKYDKDSDVCCYTNWPCCTVWRDIITDQVIENKNDTVKQLTFADTKTKKQDKIPEPVHTLYDKVVPKKPFDIKVSQKG